MEFWDSVHEGIRATCQCTACRRLQWDFWQVVSCQDHGDGAPNLLLDGPEGGQTSDVDRYRSAAFCPFCDSGDEHIPNLAWDNEWLACDKGGALLGEVDADYASPWRCTWAACRDCLNGWKEIYTLTGSNPDDDLE